MLILVLYGFMITCNNFQIKSLPNQIFNQKRQTFYVRNSNGQFQNKILNSPVNDDFTMKLGRISGGALIP